MDHGFLKISGSNRSKTKQNKSQLAILAIWGVFLKLEEYWTVKDEW